MTTTLEIARKYVQLCKNGDHHGILETLFSKDATSVEAAAMPGNPAEVRGVKAIGEKGKKWTDNHEVHSATTEGPWPHGDRFIVRFAYDVTNKPSGRRFKLDEAALLTVEGGKIVREEFFYATEG
jgi:ketosteroid isomerase-like protein